MNKKYERYINYIVNDIELPYFNYMRDHYGLKQDEMDLVLSRVYNQPVTIKDNSVYNNQGNEIYREYSTGYWVKYEYDTDGNEIYYEDSYGYWTKREYNQYGKVIYVENSNGFIIDNR